MKTAYYKTDGTVTITGEDDPLTQKDYEDAIQNILDETANSKGYSDMVSACSYAGYPNRFQTEAISLGVWRSNCWDIGYTVLNEVLSGTRVQPTLEEFITLIPKYGA